MPLSQNTSHFSAHSASAACIIGEHFLCNLSLYVYHFAQIIISFASYLLETQNNIWCCIPLCLIKLSQCAFYAPVVPSSVQYA